MSDKKLASLLKRKIEDLTKVKRWPATIVSEAGRLGFSTVKFSNGLEMDVMNIRISSAAGLKVSVGYDPISPGVLQVLGVRETLSIPGLITNWVYWVANHHRNHEAMGPDMVWIDGMQFLPFNAIPTTGLTVRVYGGVLRGTGEWLTVGTSGYEDVDLTANQPAAGAIWALIEIDNTGTVVVTESAVVNSHTLLTIANVPEPTPGRLPIAAFKLYDGQTTIHVDTRPYKKNDWLDLRWAGYSTGGATDYDLAATIHAATAEAITDDDEMGFWENIAIGLRKITWANIKATLKTYFDTIYAAFVHTHAATAITSSTLDGDRLPGLSATKKGGVPATGAPSGLLLRDDGTWVAGGTGDVVGPASSVDSRIATFDGVTGKLIKDSGYVVEDFMSAISGWSGRSETWTRTGNHTFTIATDLTATYRKGTKVRYKQGGSFEYGVVGSSSYSAPNTTVTLITNDDYAMAAGAITDTAISYIENPEGFPNSFNYTPTLSGGGSMTIASSTINIAKWWTSGAICKFTVSIEVSFGGTAHSVFTVSNPIAASVGAVAFAANCRDTGLGSLPVGTGTAGPTTLAFRKANVSNWTLAATSSVYGSGEYPF